VTQKPLDTARNMLIVVYQHSAYMCWPSEMFEMFSFYTDTLSESFWDACTHCLTKQHIIANVNEGVFDEKLKFFTHTLHLSQHPIRNNLRCKITWQQWHFKRWIRWNYRTYGLSLVKHRVSRDFCVNMCLYNVAMCFSLNSTKIYITSCK